MLLRVVKIKFPRPLLVHVAIVQLIGKVSSVRAGQVRLTDVVLDSHRSLRFEVHFQVPGYGMMQLNIDSQNKRQVVAEYPATPSARANFSQLGPPPNVTAPHPSGAAVQPSFGPSAAASPDEWHYLDPQGNIQGPFTTQQMRAWRAQFPTDLPVIPPPSGGVQNRPRPLHECPELSA